VSSEFRASNLGDLDDIAELMRIAFHAPPGAPFLDRALLQWKYFEPGPEWTGSRSYVLRKDGALLAHGCAWPVKLLFEGQTRSAITLVDWAGSSASLGAGLQLVHKLSSLAEILISIGGSAATRQMMPRIGFQVVDEQALYARPLRPWRQFRTRPGPATPREIVRLLRNTAYSLAPRAKPHRWSLHPVATLHPKLFVDTVPDSGPASAHGSSFGEYMTRCPVARITTYELHNDGRPEGYVVLSHVHGQTRIAEIRMRSRRRQDWTAAIGAIVNKVSEIPDACELVAWTSLPDVRHALESSGFRLRDRRSIFVRDPRKLIAAGPFRWDLTLLDDDSAFLNFPDYPYAT
jgi:hypothetical protein